MSVPARLAFSIGPVQTFVSQSRRTRDLWASSFLLSDLAKVAMNEVKRRGNLLVPAPSAIETQANRDFGALPNRFIADFSDASAAAQAASAATTALQNRWQVVADAVWSESIDKIVQSDGNLTQHTRSIWDRQVQNFWELTWTVSAPDQSSRLIAARKNWRTTPATIEPGDHCTLMHDRQELSGWIRSVSRDQLLFQDRFWASLRRNLGSLDLADDERLCAIALIKRLYPKSRVQKSLFPERSSPIAHNNWPSTVYIAAVPWLEAIASNGNCQATARQYAEEVEILASQSFGERHSKIPRLAELKRQGKTGRFLELDGNFFQQNALANSNVTPFDSPDGDDSLKRKNLSGKLEELFRVSNGKPSPFYAILLMDGDSMGKLLNAAGTSNDDSGSPASKALAGFTENTPRIVGAQLGVTIYAGGDDVLAMLPCETALKCAIQLADEYRKAFTHHLPDSIARLATLSGAIVFAHYHTPLQQLLKTAHHLLDDIAKDATGRDSLAIAVYKSSGITAQWAAPWNHIRTLNGIGHPNNIIDALLLDINGPPSASATSSSSTHLAEFSASFLYNIRERFASLTDSSLTRPGEFGTLSSDLTHNNNELLTSVLLADFLRGKARQQQNDPKPDHALAAIQRLLKVCQRVTRTSDHDCSVHVDTNTLGIDGALLIRFLATEAQKNAR